MCSSRRYGALIGLAWLLATPAQAQVTPLIFEREDIRIESPPHPITAEDTKNAAASTNPKSPGAASPHAPLTYNVEVRPEDALRLEYIHTLNELPDAGGVMIVFTAPSVIGLPALKVPTAVDALFVLDNGTITQILPNVVLADLTQEVVAQAPIKAFLFLKAGTVTAQHIHPQDVVVGKKFTPAPPLLQ